LISLSVCEAAPVALALLLDTGAPRHVEAAEQTVRCGVAIPMLRLWPTSAVLHLRAELALERFGLG
jgi:hypothetical protein